MWRICILSIFEIPRYIVNLREEVRLETEIAPHACRTTWAGVLRKPFRLYWLEVRVMIR
jgi:hypothetical protein